MNTRSIRFRLTMWHAGLLSAVVLFLGLLVFVVLQNYLESNLADTQARRARQIADTLLASVGSGGESGVAAEVKSLYAPEANDRFIRITRADHTVIYASGRPKDESFDPVLVPPPVVDRRAEFSRKVLQAGDKALLIATCQQKGGNGTDYWVEVGASTRSIDAILRQARLLLMLGLPVILIVAIGGGYLLVTRALAPVDQIAHKAEQITHHNLSERLPVARTGDELERLSMSLNHMIERLEDAIDNSKRFVADASHELRTPLTFLRGELENFIQDTRVDANARETMGSMLEEVERLANIVEGLVALSRLDAGEAQARRESFDLAELAGTTADQMNLLAEDKSILVVCDAGEPVVIEGDRARLKQVVVNLLDNAIKYTPAGGEIRLAVHKCNGLARLEVTDNGVGIPQDALTHVFKRFFRVDAARSRDQGGSGLGLSIVKSICTAHGAEVQVESAPGKGSRFSVQLPLATAPGEQRSSG